MAEGRGNDNLRSLLSPELYQRLEEAKNTILSYKGIVRLVSHYDADGICAAGILCNAFLKANLKFHTTLSKNLDEEFFEAIKKEKYSLIIFCDMGSGQLEKLETFENEVIILDHHAVLRDSKKICQINSHLFGIDGTYECSASSLAFLLALALDESNWDIAYLAVAGSIGDRQDMGGLKGLNKLILESAIDRRILDPKVDLILEGNDLKTVLRDSCEPYLTGVTGREEEVKKLLANLGIEESADLRNLNTNARRLLISFLMTKLLAQGARPETVENIVGERYFSSKKEMYVTDLANYLNACGRLNKQGLGVAVCLDEPNAMKEAINLRAEYRKKVRENLLKLEKNGVQKKEHIQYFYQENAPLAGACAGLGMLYMLDQEKPALALSPSEKIIRVSARGTRYLVSKGLDLAEACRKAAEILKGSGGGHNIAAGATIPKDKVEDFLNIIDKIIGEQLSKKIGLITP